MLLNKYIQIKPLEYDSFISQNKTTYEEIGVVVDVDPSITDIPIGAKVYFDSFMAKKYAVGNDDHAWFVHYNEIVKVDNG